MNRATRKLLTTILVATITLITLVASTFAWITLTNTVTVTSFTADVTTSEGIEVSIDGGNSYYSDVPTDAMQAEILRTLGPNFRFEIVTSDNGTSFVDFLDPDRIVDTNYAIMNFIFRSRKATSIYLDEGSAFTSSGISWTSDAEFSTGNGNLILPGDVVVFKAANAARISLDSDSIPRPVIFELPASDDILKNRIDLIPGKPDKYVFEAGNTVLNDTAIEAGAVEYYNIKRTIPLDINDAVLPTSFTDLTSRANPVLILGEPPVDGDGFVYGTLSVRIWIEGWDPECFNSILDDLLLVGLVFKAEYPE